MTDDPQHPSWARVLDAMVREAGTEPPIHGVIASADPAPGGAGWVSFAGQQRPTFVGATGPDRTLWRVWRHGARIRVENQDGHPLVLSDGVRSWRFDTPGEPPLEDDASAVRFIGSAVRLVVRRSANDFVGDDFTRPTGPITTTVFLGRPAWAVELGPPPHKPFPIQLVVDQETGLVLQQRNDDAGLVSDEWIELSVGAPIDDDVFSWPGPVRTRADEQRRMRERALERQRQHREWFARTVTPEPLSIQVDVPLDIETVHEFDEATGAFTASLGRPPFWSMLARRPRSAEPWELGWAGSVHRWSTAEFDWALRVDGAEPTAQSLARLRELLGG
ncbi:hypothetical protein [Nocardia cyriacigeorgica]|uniref:hypothetical protein n=1 Tax=Nocardia cyriacigeorgica TaxID=135487 RepID=UPI0013D51D2C|nr:hypothetical protein [Nocardia cyriacigeorgica]NEW26536.1 hypothetical protein [Nocardia cyriacigeorgica]